MSLILGIDEVGRGAWAGPLAVGAVVFDSRKVPAGLRDSKKLTKIQREKLSREIKKSAVSIGVGWVDAKIIDQIGLSRSLKLAAENAFSQIPLDIRENLDQIIVDGTIKLLDDPRAITLVKADDKISSVSAASIVAKVVRDHYMCQLDKAFFGYNFANDVGYGTKAHAESLRKIGVVRGVHRESFAPVAKLLGAKNWSQVSRNAKQKLGFDSRKMGYLAETVAAEFLLARGHEILARNWKTKFCEIDIVSSQRKILYFTEVKFRENANYGDGLAAITPKKLAQMRKSAEIFLAKNDEFAKNFDVQIAAISLSKNPPEVDEFIENVV